jgi:hypothetical protein
MTKIWSEPFDPERHRNPMNWGWGAPPADEIPRHWRAPTLERHAVLFVRVCSFTFEFHNLDQLRACLAYYAQKLHPTSRLPVTTQDYGGDHTETQRWFERLPAHLREETKRVQVVAALEEALRRAAEGKL